MSAGAKEKSNKTAKIVFWVLTAAVMAAIFYFSSRTADQSNRQSGVFAELWQKLFGTGDIANFIVRKIAHFTEFAALGFFSLGAFRLSFKGAKRLFFIPLCLAWAALDEVHQIFVPGRACLFTDWLIDSAGVFLGALVCFLIFKIVSASKRKKQKTSSA